VLQSQVGDPEKFEETWNVQIFRSIDSSSAAGLPHTQAALKMGLSAQKGKTVDFSIQARAGCSYLLSVTTCMHRSLFKTSVYMHVLGASSCGMFSNYLLEQVLV